MKEALLVIDPQKVYALERSPLYVADYKETVDRINLIIDRFEAEGLPIIYIRHIHQSREDSGRMFDYTGEELDMAFLDGTEEVSYMDELTVTGGIPEIIKRRYSSFEGTELDRLLKDFGVECVVITGFMTNYCCETAARAAHDKDYHVKFILDATSAPPLPGIDVPTIKRATAAAIAGGFGMVMDTSELLSQHGKKADDRDMYARPYYTKTKYRPALFYAVFGVSGDELEVSVQKHGVTEVPRGISIMSYDKASDGGKMQGLMESTLGDMLKASDPELFEKCASADRWVMIRGNAAQDERLDYLKNISGIIQAFTEKGAVGILDLFTLSLISPKRWTKEFFMDSFEPRRHAEVFVSEEESGNFWVHTRGMIKFGRPDISFEGISWDEVDKIGEIVGQMIYFGAMGAFFDKDVKLHISGGRSFIVRPELVDDPDNDDFNNVYYSVSVMGEQSDI